MGGRIAPEDFPALPGVRASRVFQMFENLDLTVVLYLMSCGFCLASIQVDLLCKHGQKML